jgi:hypothetical protein
VTLKPYQLLTDISGSITLYYSDGTRKSQAFLFAAWEYGEEKVIEFQDGVDWRFEKMAIRMIGTQPRMFGIKVEYNVDLLKTDFLLGHHFPSRPEPP